jgi:uncharacterized membrane protein YbaN (DUF454 family)
MNSDDGEEVVSATSVDDQLRVSRSAAARALYFVLGLIFLGIGIAGFYLPVLPGTINLLAAAYFFSMSSERMFRWMMTNKAFGQQLQDYRAGLGIPRKVKVIAVVSIVASVTLTVTIAMSSPWPRAAMVLFGLVGVWFVLTRPTREVELERATARSVLD